MHSYTSRFKIILQTQILQNIIHRQLCTVTSGIGGIVTNPKLFIFIEQAADKYYISKEAITFLISSRFKDWFSR